MNVCSICLSLKGKSGLINLSKCSRGLIGATGGAATAGGANTGGPSRPAAPPRNARGSSRSNLATSCLMEASFA